MNEVARRAMEEMIAMADAMERAQGLFRAPKGPTTQEVADMLNGPKPTRWQRFRRWLRVAK